MNAIPEDELTRIVSVEGILSSNTNTIETMIDATDRDGAYTPVGNNPNPLTSTIECKLRLNSAQVTQQYDWTKHTAQDVEFFVLPQYSEKHFGPQLIEFPIDTEWATLTPRQAIINHIMPQILQALPILNELNIRNIFGYNNVNGIIRPYLNLPSGCGVYIHPKSFFDLLGFAAHTSELFTLFDDEHPKINTLAESYWGIYNYNGEAALYDSDSDHFKERTPFSDLYYIDPPENIEIDGLPDEDIVMPEPETKPGGRKRIASDGQLHREPTAKRQHFNRFLGFSTQVKIYIYFDNSGTAMVRNRLTGRKKPQKSVTVPIYTSDKINDIMHDFNKELNLLDPSRNIFDASLTAISDAPPIFTVETTYDDDDEWKLTMKPKLALSSKSQLISNYEHALVFEVFINKLFAKLLGYEVPLVTEQLISIPFFRYRKLTFTNSLLIRIDEVKHLIRDPYPLFLCIIAAGQAMLTPNMLGSRPMSDGYTVAAVINSTTTEDVYIPPQAHDIKLKLNEPSKLKLQLISRTGTPVQDPIHVFATFLITRKKL